MVGIGLFVCLFLCSTDPASRELVRVANIDDLNICRAIASLALFASASGALALQPMRRVALIQPRTIGREKGKGPMFVANGVTGIREMRSQIRRFWTWQQSNAGVRAWRPRVGREDGRYCQAKRIQSVSPTRIESVCVLRTSFYGSALNGGR